MAETQSTDSAQSESQGSGAPEAAKESLTEERVSEMINRAVSGRFKDYEKKSAKQLEEFGAKFGSTLEEKLAAFKPQGSSGSSDEVKKAAPAAATQEMPKLEDNPEFQKLLKAHKDLERQARKADEARAAAEAKQRDGALRETVREALKKSGCAIDKVSVAAGYLIDSQKSVGWGDEDSIVFKGEDESLDLSSGVAAWLKTDEGKHFLPARGSAGSGERPSNGKPNPESPQSETAIWDALGTWIVNR